MIFNQDKKKIIEDAFARGYKSCEVKMIKQHEIEKQKIIDDLTWEIEKLRLEKKSLESDVAFYTTQYKQMNETYQTARIVSRRNDQITSRIFHYADELSKNKINLLQEFGMLKSDAVDTNKLLEEKK
jgi:hypothetical protein